MDDIFSNQVTTKLTEVDEAKLPCQVDAKPDADFELPVKVDSWRGHKETKTEQNLMTEDVISGVPDFR